MKYLYVMNFQIIDPTSNKFLWDYISSNISQNFSFSDFYECKKHCEEIESRINSSINNDIKEFLTQNPNYINMVMSQRNKQRYNEREIIFLFGRSTTYCMIENKNGLLEPLNIGVCVDALDINRHSHVKLEPKKIYIEEKTFNELGRTKS